MLLFSLSASLPLLGLLAGLVVTFFAGLKAFFYQIAKPRKYPTANSSPGTIAGVMRNFIKEIRYEFFDPDHKRRQLLFTALDNEVNSWRLDIPKAGGQRMLSNTLHHAVAMAELSFHDHSPEVQLQIAIFTWFMLYLDDLAHTMPSALQGLQSLLFTLKEMEDPVFSHFLQNLAHMYKHWDFLPANGITCASFEFVNGCALESHPEFQNINSSVSSPSWSYYLRAKTGVAPAYAFMIFPAAEHPTLARYLPAIPDICLFIDLTNDVLSFYKEELAGETANYIHNRACAMGKPPFDVLIEVMNEASAAHHRVTETLRIMGTTKECQAWRTFVNGYVSFHLTQDRYRLQELNLFSV